MVNTSFVCVEKLFVMVDCSSGMIGARADETLECPLTSRCALIAGTSTCHMAVSVPTHTHTHTHTRKLLKPYTHS